MIEPASNIEVICQRQTKGDVIVFLSESVDSKVHLSHIELDTLRSIRQDEQPDEKRKCQLWMLLLQLTLLQAVSWIELVFSQWN